jgi:hypothetical protein
MTEHEPYHDRAPGAIVADTFTVLGAHAARFYPALCLAVALPVFAGIGMKAMEGEALPAAVADLPIPWVSWVSNWMVAVATMAYLLLYLDGYFDDRQRLELDDLWHSMRPLLRPLALVMVLGLGWLSVLAAVVVETATAMGAMTVGIVGVLALFGIFLVIFPGMMLAIPVAAVEEEGVWVSLRRGYSLSKDYFLQTFGVLLILILIRALLNDAINVGKAVLVADAWAAPSIERAVDGFARVTSYLLNSMLYAGITFQYFSLVVREEQAVVLHERVEQIGEEEDEEPLF